MSSRILVLVAVATVAFLVGINVQFVATTILAPVPTWSKMTSCVLAGALAASAVSSVPVAVLFPRRTWLPALAVAAPVIALPSSDFAYSGPELQLRILGLIQVITYAGAVIGGAWFVSRWLSRSNSHMKQIASHSVLKWSALALFFVVASMAGFVVGIYAGVAIPCAVIDSPTYCSPHGGLGMIVTPLLVAVVSGTWVVHWLNTRLDARTNGLP